MSKNTSSVTIDSGFHSSVGSEANDDKIFQFEEVDERRVLNPKELNTLLQMRKFMEKMSYEERRTFLYTPDTDGDTKLHLALIHGFESLALEIINYATSPSDLNQLNNESITPLHLAVYQNFSLIIRTLVINGADQRMQDRNGNTALHLSCIKGYDRCIDELITPIKRNEGRKTIRNNKSIPLEQIVYIRNFNGLTCLHEAVINGSLDALNKLLVKTEFQATMNDEDYKSGRTIVHFAVDSLSRDFNPKILEKILDFRNIIDIEATTFSGYTALDIAEGLKNEEAVRILKSHTDDGFESMNVELENFSLH